MQTHIFEIEISENILQQIAETPTISLEKCGLLKFINDEIAKLARTGVTVRPVWELFLRTRYLVLERITND